MKSFSLAADSTPTAKSKGRNQKTGLPLPTEKQ